MTDAELVSLNLRKFPESERAKARRTAGAHGLTMGEYVCALMELHADLIAGAAGGNKNAAALLAKVGLAPRTT